MPNFFGLSPWFLTVFSCLLSFMSQLNDPSYQGLFRFNENKIIKAYDFIIIGAGSAGSVLANRLSEVENWKILLVEAGGEEDAISDTPMLAMTLWNSDKDWNYTTVEQNHACRDEKGRCQYPRGHVLGGSSSINFMNYVRGNKVDYDNWMMQGNDGWGYEDVLPYFLKSEDMRIESLANSEYHSTGGYLTIERKRYSSPVQSTFVEASQALGYQLTDFNGETQTGFGYPQYNMRDGSRCSAAKAFLSGIKTRRNLHIAKRTLALKVNLNKNNDKAVGVTLLKNGKKLDVKATKEVILAAGAIDSPKLLMLSGIGPKEHLKEVGITSKVDLPVGKNLVDHAYVSLLFKVSENVTITRRKLESIEAMSQYAEDRTGPFGSMLGIELLGHFSLGDKSSPLPDVQTFMCDFFSFHTEEPIIHMTITKLRPASVGSVKLRSSDPFDPPLIDPQFFSSTVDFEDTVIGCLQILELMATPAFAKYKPEIYAPDFCQHKTGEDYCRCAVEYFSRTMYHPTGTARMAEDGVVSSNLHVWTVPNLRVIDASIMPNITSGNTNAPTIMIGEKGADIIKRQWNVI